MTSKVRFGHNQFKNHNLVISRNFRPTKSNIKGRWEWRAPSDWQF